MKIAFTITRLRNGGAERVLSHLVHGLHALGHSVAVVTLDDSSNDSYALPDDCVRIGLALSGASVGPLAGLRNSLRRIRALREALRELQPDVIVSFMDRMNVMSLAAASPLAIPVVISERNNAARQNLPPAWRVARRHFYRRAAVFVVQTNRAAHWYRARRIGPPARVIPNPVFPPDTATPHSYDLAEFRPGETSHTIIAAGRLVSQKGFDLLLDAFATVAARHPSWGLIIFGEGVERANLLQRVMQLGLERRVALPGAVSDLPGYLRQADIFVLSSRFEGFPNVLLEAMSVGTPVVAVDCPFGPAEIITHQSNGLLVPAQDTDALAHAIDALIRDGPLARQLASTAQRSVERYRLEEIARQWHELLVAAAPLLRQSH